MSETGKSTTPLIVLSAVLTASVFLLDLLLPLGVAGGVPYVFVVLVSLWLPRQRDTVIAATVCTVLTIVGFYLSASGSVLWIVITNRSLAIFAIWTTAILSLYRKRSQEEQRLQSEITTNMSEGVSLIRVSDCVIVYTNPRFEEVFGYGPGEMVGKPVSIVNAPTDMTPQETVDHIVGILKHSGVWEGEIQNIKKDGTPFWCHVSASLFEHPEFGEVIVSVHTDINDRKRAEEKHQKLEDQLRQSQKMDAVGQLAGGVAHDFNNLLQAILGYGDLALDEAEADHPVRAHLEDMLKAGRRATTLVSQLLAFSRQQVLDMQDVDLNDVNTDLMKMIRRVIGEHITLDVYAGHDLWTVRVDRGQIEQILMNLCVNARDAMPDGGTITIETENVWIDEAFCESHSWAEQGRYVLLTVTDTGCGMDEQTLGQVFEPFFTTKEVGTGLGLSTVYGLVKQHQGLINIYSEVDKGTAFKIYLPCVEGPAAAVRDKIEGSVSGGTETILLAEDQEMVRNPTKAILERAGYTVLAACDGEEALRVFEDKVDKIDLALLDVMMPNLGGRAVFERIRETTQRVRVLFTSGYSVNAVHTNFVLDQGVALIQKPYPRDALLRKVREVLDS